MLSSFKKIALLSPIIKFHVEGKSMVPTIQQGDSVLVNRMSYLFRSPNVDDIIALYDPRDRKILIKRIIKIEKGKYFVQGDNKNSSTDSRVFGMIGRVDIIGKIIRKL
ncbi:MAG TPA: signal peptidase I [Candidatus Saccharimonadales bacterium]|nr:signal peptidase I [Candidatus Saccharimonadales bacterium]